jgi:hypothetical protein
LDFLKDKGLIIGDWIILNKNEHPMLVNIFRKDIYKKNETLADDFERSLDIWDTKKLIITPKEDIWPRFISIGETYTFNSLLQQKKRTALAREQLKKRLNGRKLGGWQLYKYVIDNLKNYDTFPKARKGFIIISLIFLLGSFLSIFKKNKSTKEGWKLRAR